MPQILRRERDFRVERAYGRRAGWSTVLGVGAPSIDGTMLVFKDAEQDTNVVYLGVDRRSQRHFYIHKRLVYSSDHLIAVEGVRALLNQDERRLRAVVAAALAADESPDTGEGRQPIPDDVKIFVWQRDQGRCFRCGSQDKLEFDHIIPVVMGGSNTARNLQLLCETCNRTKSGNLV